MGATNNIFHARYTAMALANTAAAIHGDEMEDAEKEDFADESI